MTDRMRYNKNKLRQSVEIAKLCGEPFEPSVPYTISTEKLMECFELINIGLIPSKHMLKTTVDDDTITITYNLDWDKDMSDVYHINRWLTRR